jgi:hypothetical protein
LNDQIVDIQERRALGAHPGAPEGRSLR